MKRIIAVLLTLVMCAGVLSGCGNKSDKKGWAYVEEKGKLIVGLDDTFAPMGFRDEKNNLVGFDIDLANEVGKVLGVDIEFQPIDWNAKDLELSSKSIDCIWNGMSATDERKETMALTKQYLNNQIVIMSLDKSINIKSADELANYNVGTQAKSAALEAIEANESYDLFKDKVTEYKTYDEAILDMRTGRIDCIVVDRVLGEYKNNVMDDKMTMSDFNFGDDYYAIGCRKGETDLADKISDAIGTLIDNGKAAEISEKWFGENIVTLKDYD